MFIESSLIGHYFSFKKISQWKDIKIIDIIHFRYKLKWRISKMWGEKIKFVCKLLLWFSTCYFLEFLDIVSLIYILVLGTKRICKTLQPSLCCLKLCGGPSIFEKFSGQNNFWERCWHRNWTHLCRKPIKKWIYNLILISDIEQNEKRSLNRKYVVQNTYHLPKKDRQQQKLNLDLKVIFVKP